MMSLRAKKRTAGEVCCVLRVACQPVATRNTQHATPTPHSAFRIPHSRRAFTLIEIMIVVAIMGIVMTMSVPIVYKVWRKAPMRQAVGDIVEVFSHARARAIMTGTMTEVIMHPRDNLLGVSGSIGTAQSAEDARAASVGNARASSSASSGLSAVLSKDVIIETLDINMSGVEYNDADTAVIHFYPNGISDEMRMILFDGRERMGVELETTTGLANAVHDPLREWTRR
jgi:prepilin-type N-terminal cleavage/methylation domain-containing protein